MVIKTSIIVISFFVILQSTTVHAAPSVNGFAVSIKGKPFYIRGARNGMVWRHDIENGVPIRHTVLDSGMCNEAVISPDGKKIAYIIKDPFDCTGNTDHNCPYSNGTLWVMDSDGRNKKQLTTVPGVCCPLDFPCSSYVYFGSDALTRVDLSGRTQRWDLPYQPIQLGISNDLTRAILRCSDFGGTPKGLLIALDMTTLPATAYREAGGGTGSEPSCGSGMASDGQTYMDGWIDHDGFDVRKWSDASVVKSFSNATAFRWGPADSNKIKGATSHTAWDSRSATNSPQWHCISNGYHQILLNWVDQQCVVPTADLAVTSDNCFGSGDFWVGTLPTTSSVTPQIKLSQIQVIKTTMLPGIGLTIAVGETSPYTISLTDVSGRSVWSARNNRPNEYRIPRAALNDGAIIIKVQSAKGIVIRRMISH